VARMTEAKPWVRDCQDMGKPKIANDNGD
jgi:hypothetical protein